VSVAAGKFAGLTLMVDGSMGAFGDLAYYIGGVPARMTNVVAIAAGWSNGVVLVSDGTVQEWTVDWRWPYAPPPVAGISNIVAISAGYYHRAGIRSDSTVVAWGDNLRHQTEVPAGLSNVVAISCGGTHTLALRSDGTIVAWGDNSSGQCNVPAGLTNVVAIAGGGAHSLAVVSASPLAPFITTPLIDQTVLGNSTAWMRVGVAGGSSFSYQWSFNGMPLPAETNSFLKLVNLQRSGAGNYSVTVSNSAGGSTNVSMNLAVTPWINLQPTSQSALAGTTVTFNSTSGGLSPGNYQWQFNGTNLAQGTNSSLLLANVQLNQAGVYSVSISNSFGMVTSAAASLAVGALTITTQPQSKATWQLGSTGVLAVAASGTGPFNYQWRFNGTNLPGATVASLIFSNIQPAQFGSYDAIVANAYGSLTSSVAILSYSQVAIWPNASSLPIGLTNVIAIAGGGAVLLASGKVGVLGNGSPIRTINNLNNVAAISGTLNGGHLALLTNGTAVPWFPDGAVSPPLSGVSNAVAIAALNYNGLVLLPNGTLAGLALQGAPLKVTALSNAVAISQGLQHSIVLAADGNVLAWGNNNYGQANIPPGLSNVVAIDAGSYHNLALKSDGTVLAWGMNFGQQTNVPPGLSNVVAVAAGANHSLALKSDGKVVAWGFNGTGLTNVPPGLTNVVAIAADHDYCIALIGAGPPQIHALLSNPIWSSNGFSLSLSTESGRVYALEYKNSFADSNWLALPLVAGNGRTLTLQDPSAATNSHRFYRVRRW
jgi:hypothetical protein